jgi:dipeptidyl aminopeptidase/acylaminoacyl peptidase
VQAVVDLYGPADLPRLFAVSAQNLAQSVFGVRRSADPFLQEASPIHHITSGDAPFLILHGTQDSQVSLEQSQALDTALNAAGVDSTLIVVEGAGHGFPRGGDYSPGYDELSQKIAEFFDKYLGK